MEFKAHLVILIIFSCLVCLGTEQQKFGNVSYTLPNGWVKLSEKSFGNSRLIIQLSNKKENNLLAITYLPSSGASVDSQDKLDKLLVDAKQKYAVKTVEGKTVVNHLKTPNLICSYANHTDKSLVGKSIQKDNWKYTTMGFAKLDNIIIHFTYFTNDKDNINEMNKNKGLAIIKTLLIDSK